MKENYTFPAELDFSEKGVINLSFPDIEEAYTCVETGEDYISAAQEVLALGKLAVKLVVQIVSVRDYHNCGAFHLLLQQVGIKDHGQGFARALGMPEHAAAAVPAGAGGLDRGGHRLSDRKILMIAGKDLVAGHALVAETDEVLQNVQKACLLKHALEEGIELGMGFVFIGAVLGFPLHESIFSGGNGACL